MTPTASNVLAIAPAPAPRPANAPLKPAAPAAPDFAEAYDRASSGPSRQDARPAAHDSKSPPADSHGSEQAHQAGHGQAAPAADRQPAAEAASKPADGGAAQDTAQATASADDDEQIAAAQEPQAEEGAQLDAQALATLLVALPQPAAQPVAAAPPPVVVQPDAAAPAQGVSAAASAPAAAPQPPLSAAEAAPQPQAAGALQDAAPAAAPPAEAPGLAERIAMPEAASRVVTTLQEAAAELNVRAAQGGTRPAQWMTGPQATVPDALSAAQAASDPASAQPAETAAVQAPQPAPAAPVAPAAQAPAPRSVAQAPARPEAAGPAHVAAQLLPGRAEAIAALPAEAKPEPDSDEPAPALTDLAAAPAFAPEPAKASHAQRAEAPVATVRAEDLAPAVLKQAEWLKSQQQSSVKLQLYPEHLGKLEIRVAQQQGVLTATLTADTPQVKALLETQIAGLHRSLADLGLKLDRVEVAVSSSQLQMDLGGRTAQDGAGFGQPRHGAPQGQGAAFTASAEPLPAGWDLEDPALAIADPLPAATPTGFTAVA